MPTPKCIVAATDFSGTSRAALHVVRDLADAIGAHVHLLHVIPDPARLPYGMEAGLVFADLERDWRARAQRSLEQARDEAGLAAGRTALVIAMGDAAHEIVASARSLRADIIVMGTHGHGFVARLVMGSVADKVLRHADRPVLIVPHPALRHMQASASATEEVGV